MPTNCNPDIVESTSGDVSPPQPQTQNGGKKKQGRRRPLKTKLEINEFYCLTCRGKRKIRSSKKIEVDTAKNGKKIAKAQCTAKDCTRKLVKILSNDQADKIKDFGKKKVPTKNIPKEKRSSLK